MRVGKSRRARRLALRYRSAGKWRLLAGAHPTSYNEMIGTSVGLACADGECSRPWITGRNEVSPKIPR